MSIDIKTTVANIAGQHFYISIIHSKLNPRIDEKLFIKTLIC